MNGHRGLDLGVHAGVQTPNLDGYKVTRNEGHLVTNKINKLLNKLSQFLLCKMDRPLPDDTAAWVVMMTGREDDEFLLYGAPLKSDTGKSLETGKL